MKRRSNASLLASYTDELARKAYAITFAHLVREIFGSNWCKFEFRPTISIGQIIVTCVVHGQRRAIAMAIDILGRVKMCGDRSIKREIKSCSKTVAANHLSNLDLNTENQYYFGIIGIGCILCRLPDKEKCRSVFD
jgi:hypothetical protein